MKSNLQRKVMRLGAALLVLGALGACCGPWGPGPGPGGGGRARPVGGGCGFFLVEGRCTGAAGRRNKTKRNATATR